jgi:ketosteroid isomerase-like protein
LDSAADRRAVLERGFAAFSAGDFDRAIEFVHPEFEFIPVGGQAPVKGAAALRAWMEPDAFASQKLEILEAWPAGDRLLVHSLATNRAAGSGIEMEVEIWAIWTFDDDDRATRVGSFFPTSARRLFRRPAWTPSSA